MSAVGLGNDVHSAMVVAAIVAVVIIIILRSLSFLAPHHRDRYRDRYPQRSHFLNHTAFDPAEIGQQLSAVMGAPFQRRRLLSPSEFRVFKAIEDDLATARQGYRVFAQTSLGEVLASSDKNAFRSINSKRVDILVVDRGGWPVVAVEYQGSGHYQGTAAARDAIKKEALRKAGVRYIEVAATDSNVQIRTRLREQLGWKTVPPAVDGDSAYHAPTPSGFGRRNVASG